MTKTDEGKVDLAGWEHYDWPDWVNTQIKLLPQEYICKKRNIFPFSPKYLAKQGINPENQILLRKFEIHVHPF